MPERDPFHQAAAAHVRGAGALRRRAGFGPRLGALVLDGSLSLAAFFLLHRALRLAPVPALWWPAAIAALAALPWLAQRRWLKRTAGEAAWQLTGAAKSLMMPAKYSAGETLIGVFLTGATLTLCAWSIDLAIFRQPVWARAETLELDAYLPDMASGDWDILPFFYTLGAWPRRYGQKPVFYSLPYEKGPPTRFIGHLTARWEEPDTRVVFEGPKTPQAPASPVGERTPRERIRQCLLEDEHSWECLKIREATLLRHLNEMQQRLAGIIGGNTALKMKWRLRWFLVRNPALRPSEQAQGIYLSAEDGGRGEERYVLVTENGTHQAILLDYSHPGTPAADSARRLFTESIRSLRASDELTPGVAWIDRQLESVKLGSLAVDASGPPEADEAAVARLAQVQSLLIAKITVQPGVFESYYLLGGTARLLNRIARAGPNVGHLEGLELTAVAKPQIQSAFRYAQDVAPKDPRIAQLQGFLFESQKH